MSKFSQPITFSSHGTFIVNPSSISVSHLLVWHCSSVSLSKTSRFNLSRRSIILGASCQCQQFPAPDSCEPWLFHRSHEFTPNIVGTVALLLLTFSSDYFLERHVCWCNIQVEENLTLGTFEYQMQALIGFIIMLGSIDVLKSSLTCCAFCLFSADKWGRFLFMTLATRICSIVVRQYHA